MTIAEETCHYCHEPEPDAIDGEGRDIHERCADDEPNAALRLTVSIDMAADLRYAGRADLANDPGEVERITRRWEQAVRQVAAEQAENRGEVWEVEIVRGNEGQTSHVDDADPNGRTVEQWLWQAAHDATAL